MKKAFISLFIMGIFAIPGPLSAVAGSEKSQKAPEQLLAQDVKIHMKSVKPFSEIGTMGKPVDGGDGEIEEVLGAVTDGPIASGVLGSLTTGTKYAIVIGISNYPGTKYDLYDHDEDAANMLTALSNYGFEKANIYLFQDLNATRDNIYNAVIDFRDRVDENSEIVFFYSGHSATGIYGAKEGGLALTSEDEAMMVHNGRNKIQYIWDDELVVWFEGFNTSKITFVFDTCGAGGFNDLAGEDRLLLMSAGETETAHVYWQDGQMTAEGLFSHWFVNSGLIMGYADTFDHDTDSTTADITIEEAFDYAIEKIKIDSAISDQHPVSVDLFVNDLLL